MALRLRLARFGRKKAPHYAIVVAESSSARDRKIIDKIGYYNPINKELSAKDDRLQYWFSHGVLPTESVAKLLANRFDLCKKFFDKRVKHFDKVSHKGVSKKDRKKRR